MNDKPYRLLTRLEGIQRAWLYDQFGNEELTWMKKRGWKVVTK
ncbi:hypothetical protein [Sporosarcina psychrophila]|uniref:Uncharacterized protein n=1 Tax=Sporosarcina psychrophila TaxID=1476 RepID=A0ABV2KAM7_SPOPS